MLSRIINKITFLLIIIIAFSACINEVEDVYEKSAAERYKEISDKAMTTLQNSENGWLMEYFPTSSSQGYNLYVKFETEDYVIFGMKNALNGNVYQTAGSRYEITSSSNPIINFNTYNDLFHKFSDPAPNGFGYQGDFEFFIISQTDDLFELKGRKRDTRIILRKIKESISLEDYIDSSNSFSNFLFGNTTNDLYLTIDGQEYVLSRGSTGTFIKTPVGGNPEIEGELVTYITTPNELHFQYPIDGIESFIYDESNQRLISTNGSAYIIAKDPYKYFHSEIVNNKRWSIMFDNVSTEFKSGLETFRNTLTGNNRILDRFAFRYSSADKTNVLEIVTKKNNTNTVGNLYFEISEIENGTILNFKNSYDRNGKVYYDMAGLPEFIQLLNGEFVVSADFMLNQYILRIQSKTNPEFWFYVKRL